jgi:hypothetical protein
MDAVPKTGGVESPTATSRLSPRIAIRYRLARLLTEEKFDDALQEATRAYHGGEITDTDFVFVSEIVRFAQAKRPSLG